MLFVAPTCACVWCRDVVHALEQHCPGFRPLLEDLSCEVRPRLRAASRAVLCSMRMCCSRCAGLAWLQVSRVASGAHGSGRDSCVWICTVDALLDLQRLCALLRHAAEPLAHALSGLLSDEADQRATAALQTALRSVQGTPLQAQPRPQLALSEADLAHACKLLARLGTAHLWAGESYCSSSACGRDLRDRDHTRRTGLTCPCHLAAYCDANCQVDFAASARADRLALGRGVAFAALLLVAPTGALSS